jgi:hypothetical protein
VIEIRNSRMNPSYLTQFKRFKLDVEVWQLFTVITAIFSIASTFMWFGLLAPTSVKLELLAIDAKKAAIFNTYQEQIVELSAIKGLNANVNLESCQFQYTDQTDIPRIITTIESSKTNPIVEVTNASNISPEKNAQLSTISSDLTLLKTTTLSMLANMQKANALNINIVQNIINACKKNTFTPNKEIVSYIDEMLQYDFGSTYSNKLTNFKQSLFIATPGSLEYFDSLSNLLHTTPSFTYMFEQLKPIEQSLVRNIQSLEQWQRKEHKKHNYLTFKTYYIYDEA